MHGLSISDILIENIGRLCIQLTAYIIIHEVLLTSLGLSCHLNTYHEGYTQVVQQCRNMFTHAVVGDKNIFFCNHTNGKWIIIRMVEIIHIYMKEREETT